MLRLLVDYAIAKGLEAEPGFAPKFARWAIQCDEGGRYLQVVELGDAGAKSNRGREFAKCADLSQPEMKAGGITKSHFLVDAAEVVTLLGKNADDGKVLAKHAYFINLLREAASAMPLFGALAECLADETALAEIRSELEKQKAKPTDKVTFRTGSSYPVDSDAWCDWWRQFRAALADRDGAAGSAKRKQDGAGQMVCFVTGEAVTPAATHPKIGGLADVGGSAMGCSLIGFDKEAFASYGLEQSANCPVSEEAAAAYRSGLNHLIGKHSDRLAESKVVHWFKGNVPAEDDPFSFLVAAAEIEELSAQKRARDLLQAIRAGQRPDLARSLFYALTISGAAGRVMIRDWMEGPFEDLVSNVSAWFDDLAIVHREGGREAPAPKFLAVVGATVRDLKDVAPPFVAKIWRVAVRNEPIPQAALAQALARAKVAVIQDDVLNHARMGLMKAYHVRKGRKGDGEHMSEDLKAYLNEGHPSPAYHCGRLMAVLAGLQRAALETWPETRLMQV